MVGNVPHRIFEVYIVNICLYKLATVDVDGV